jgi:Spy/CpxP family protein refolding chaperone
MQDLDLGRDQIQQMQAVMEDYKSAFEAVLTDEQLEQLESLRAEQMGQPGGDKPQNLLAQLDLSDSQEDQLATLRELMVAEFEDIFTAEQLEQLEIMGLL